MEAYRSPLPQPQHPDDPYVRVSRAKRNGLTLPRLKSNKEIPQLTLEAFSSLTRQIQVFIPVSLGLAQPDTIDDGRMVQFIGYDCIVGRHQGFEYSGVGIEAARIEDGVLPAVKFRYFLFQLFVNVL